MQLGSCSVPTHLLITDGALMHRGTMIEKLRKACSGDTGPERRQEKDWSPGMLLQLGLCVCVCACMCVFTPVKEGSREGSVWSSPRASVSPPAHRLPITSLSSPIAQFRLPTLKRFSCTSFPSIRILLHSCESFSKQTWGRERMEQGREKRRLDANLALPPPSLLLPLSTFSHAHMSPPHTRRVLKYLVSLCHRLAV